MKSLLTGVLFCMLTTLTFALEYQTFEAEEGTEHWAMHATKVRIFGSVTEKGVVVEYNARGTKVREFTIDKQPAQLLVKGDTLAVACLKPLSMVLIDLTSNTVKSTVPLEGRAHYGLFASKNAKPYIYGIFQGSSYHTVYQVDIRTGTLRNQGSTGRWQRSSVTRAAMSADGTRLSIDSRGRTSPSGGYILSVDEDNFVFQGISGHHSTFGKQTAGPHNRYWMLGDKLYDFDLKDTNREVAGSPALIHPRLDLVASVMEDGIVLEPFSQEGKLLDRASFPAAWEYVPKRSKIDPYLAFTETREPYLFLAHGAVAGVVALKAPGLSPLFMMSTPGTFEAEVGGSSTFKLTVSNPSLQAGSTYKVLDGPDTLRVEGNQLVWTPVATEGGSRVVTIQATNGKQQDTRKVTLQAVVPNIEIDFYVQSMRLDPSEKTLLVYGTRRPVDSYGRSSGDWDGKTCIAILNPKTGERIARRDLTGEMRHILHDDRFLFVAPKSGNLLYRYDLKDFANAKRVFLKQPVARMFSLGNRLVLLNGDRQSSATWTYYDKDTLKEVMSAPRSNWSISEMSSYLSPISPSQALLMNRVVDKQTGAFQHARYMAGFSSLTAQPIQYNRNSAVQAGRPLLWGRQYSNSGLLNYRGTSVAKLNAPGSSSSMHSHMSGSISGGILPSLPLAYRLRTVSDNSGVRKLNLDFHDLIEGKTAASMTLHEERTRSSNNPRLVSLATKDHLIVSRGKQLLFCELPKALDVKQPLHFSPPERLVFGVDSPIKLTPKVQGGKGKVEYHLKTEYEGLECNAATGEVTIQVPAMWKALLEKSSGSDELPKEFNQLSQMGMRGRAAEVKPLVFKTISNNYAYWTGEELPEDKVPFTVPVNLLASDEEGQEDSMDVICIVLAPRAPYEESIDKAIAKQKEKQEEWAAQSRARMEQQKLLKEQAAGAGSSAELKSLESRVRRLEAALDAVLLKMEKLEKK